MRLHRNSLRDTKFPYWLIGAMFVGTIAINIGILAFIVWLVVVLLRWMGVAI